MTARKTGYFWRCSVGESGEIRKEKKLTQAELGFQVDMEKPNINRIEKGGTNPTILTLKKICAALEIELDDLFTQPSSIKP